MNANPLFPWDSLMDFLRDAALGGLLIVVLILLIAFIAWLVNQR